MEYVSLFNGEPRRPERIDPMLKELSEAWKLYPDLRLGQLLSICAKKTDLFSVEDDDLLEGIRTFANSQ